MRKTVDLYVKKGDSGCKEMQSFLEQQDIILSVRDLNLKPLRFDELGSMIRHLNLDHFLDTNSKAYSKNKLANNLPPRNEVIKLLAEDNDLLKKPIIVAGRLMVVGANLYKVREMLQIKENGSGEDTDVPDSIKKRDMVEKKETAATATNNKNKKEEAEK